MKFFQHFPIRFFIYLQIFLMFFFGWSLTGEISQFAPQHFVRDWNMEYLPLLQAEESLPLLGQFSFERDQSSENLNSNFHSNAKQFQAQTDRSFPAANEEISDRGVPYDKNLHFRKVFVPSELLHDIPVGSTPYWRMKAQDFEEWFSQSSAAERTAKPAPPQLLAEQAIYRAELIENKFLSGTASFQIRRILPENRSLQAGNLNSNSTESALSWRFESGSLALKDELRVRPFLEDSDSEPNENIHETITRREFRFLPSGSTEVLFLPDDFDENHLCQAEFNWSQSAIPGENGAIILELQWLNSTNTQWILAIPSQWIPETPDGLVMSYAEQMKEDRKFRSEMNSSAKQETDNSPDAISLIDDTASSASGNRDLKYWKILFGGKNRARLTLRPAESTAPLKTSIMSSQTGIYQIRKEGMDVFVRMNLDSIGEENKNYVSPIRTLSLQMEKNLVPTSIRFNEKEVQWQIVSSSSKSEPESSETKSSKFSENTDDFIHLSIQLPEDLKGIDNRLEISAIGNLKPWFSEGSDTLLPLPQIQLTDVFRNECKNQVQIFEPLLVSDFSFQEITLMSCSKIPGQSRFQIEFQEHSDMARFHLALTRRPAQIEMDMTTVLDFQEHEILSVTELWANCHDGECFEIWGIVDLSWMIDSVETEAVGLIEDWNLEILQENVYQSLSDLDPSETLPQKLTNSGWNLENIGILKIQLAHSVRPEHPLAFRIRARRPGYPFQTFTGIQLTPVLFPSAKINQSWLLALSSFARKISFLAPYREQKIFWENLSEKNSIALNSNPLSPNSVSGKPKAQSKADREEHHALSESETFPLANQNSIKKNTAPNLFHEKNALANPERNEESEINLSDGQSSQDPYSSSGAEENLSSNHETNPFPKPSPESDKKISFAGYPTLQAAQKHCPDHLEFLIGIQDFKNTPMIYLENSTKTFSAKISGHYDISYDPEAVYRISCNPQGAELTRMKILIRPGILLGVNWKFPPALRGSRAVCLEQAPIRNADEMASSFELWEITFPQAQREPFEFEMILLTIQMLTESPVNLLMENGSNSEYFNLFNGKNSLWEDYLPLNSKEQREWWKKHFPNGFLLPLIDLPEARECSGSILVENDVKDMIQIETQEMIPVLLPLRDFNEISGSGKLKDICLYRFNPHSISSTPEPFLKLHWRNSSLPLPQAWIWKNSCQSQFFPNGKILHSAELLVENVDASDFCIQIHQNGRQNLEVLNILVNGLRVPFEKIQISDLSENGASIRQLRIPFPTRERKNEIIVQWMERKSPLHIFASLLPPKISTNLDVLQRDWKIWIPENFVVLTSSREKTNSFFQISEKSAEGKKAFTPVNGISYLSSDSERTNAGYDSLKNPALNTLFKEKNGSSPQFAPKIEKDTIFLRLFGTLRLGKSIFSQPEILNPEDIDLPIPLDSKWIRQLSTVNTEQAKRDSIFSQYTEILSPERMPYSVVGWNFCSPKDIQPVLIVYGNILESARWFLLILTCVLTSWLLAPHRPLRIFLCGTSAVLCMLVPFVWTPIFSGIFLGIIAAFLGSSVYRHQKYVSENAKPVILIGKGKSRNKMTLFSDTSENSLKPLSGRKRNLPFFRKKKKELISSVTSSEFFPEVKNASSPPMTDSSANKENPIKNSEMIQ